MNLRQLQNCTPKKSHLHCTSVALQKVRPQSQKEEFAFSALIQMQVHLTRFLTKEFLLSFVISYN